MINIKKLNDMDMVIVSKKPTPKEDKEFSDFLKVKLSTSEITIKTKTIKKD